MSICLEKHMTTSNKCADSITSNKHHTMNIKQPASTSRHIRIMATRTIHSTEYKTSACGSLLSYTFVNPIILRQALKNASLPLCYNGTHHYIQRNDALAILGNTRMDAVLCRWWWDGGSPRNIRGQTWCLVRWLRRLWRRLWGLCIWMVRRGSGRV
jgi:hypothetical protein